MEAVREGHQSEVLLSIAEEFPAELCFTLVFHGRQGNLDLVAGTAEEAQAWVLGLRKLIHRTQTMDEKERMDQYPFWLAKAWLLFFFFFPAFHGLLPLASSQVGARLVPESGQKQRR